LTRRSAETGRTIRDLAIAQDWLTAAAFDELISPEAVCRLGTPGLPRPDVDGCKQEVIA
jgi:hypothetical protein